MNKHTNHYGHEKTNENKKGAVSRIEYHYHQRWHENNVNKESQKKLFIISVTYESSIIKYFFFRQINTKQSSNTEIEHETLFEMNLWEIKWKVLHISAMITILDILDHVVIVFKLSNVKSIQKKTNVI